MTGGDGGAAGGDGTGAGGAAWWRDLGAADAARGGRPALDMCALLFALIPAVKEPLVAPLLAAAGELALRADAVAARALPLAAP